MAALAVSAVGAGVGFMLGGPAGAYWGWFAGSLAASAMGLNRTHGPALSNVHPQQSSYGLSIPIVWADMRVGGNIIWTTDFIAHEGSGGKGGGSETPTNSFTVSCRILLAETGLFTIGRIWANGHLIDDYRVGSTISEHMPLVFYEGNPGQLPDPTEEGIIGVGMVPAYRGCASIVLTDFNLAPFGNSLPQLNVELIRVAPLIDSPVSMPIENTATGYSWPADFGQFEDNPPAPTITSWPFPGSTEHIRVRQSNSSTVRLYDSTSGDYISSAAAGAGDEYPEDANIGIGFGVYQWPIGVYRYDDDTTVKLWTLRGDPFLVSNFQANGTVAPVITSVPYFISGGQLHGVNFGQAAGLPVGHRLQSFAISQDGRVLIVTTKDPSNNYWWYRIRNGLVDGFGRNEVGSFGIENYPTAGRTTVLLNPFVVAVENNGRYLWSASTFTNQHFIGVSHIDDDGVLRYDSVATGLQLPTPPSGGSQTSLVTLAEEGYAGIVYENVLILLTRVSSRTDALLLSDIAAEICTRAGTTAYDVSDIEIPVRGYMLNQTPCTARSALESILPAFFVDVVESDGVIKFRRRGVMTPVVIPSVDLAYHKVGDRETPDRLLIVHGNDLSLPAKMVISYYNVDAEYMTGSQPWDHLTGGSSSTQTINCPICFTDTEAKQKVGAWGQITWLERDKYEWITGRKYMNYEPTDVFEIEGIELRALTKTEEPNGAIHWTGVRSRAGTLVQPGVPGASGGFVPQTPLTPQETEALFLDIPYLVSDDARRGVTPVAFAGADRRSWPGASLVKSTDGGTTYKSVLTALNPDTIGETLTVLPNSDAPAFDEAAVLRVQIHPGGAALVSAVRDAVFAGANMAVVGRVTSLGTIAEIIGFRTPTQVTADTWDLTGILRGLCGTEWAMGMHAIGDFFCLLPTNTAMEILRSDLAVARLFKAITLNRPASSATPISFRSNGMGLAPYSPRFLRYGFNAGGDIVIEWDRRTRLNPGWLNFRSPTGGPPPLGEETEAYVVKIYADGTLQQVIREEKVRTATYTYLSTDQATDFGSALFPLYPAIDVAQVGSLGPGVSCRGILPLFVPAATPGYVPPNPDPVDGILSVMPWSAPGHRITSGSFGPNDQWHIQITTGNIDSVSLVTLDAAEFAGPPTLREGCLSTRRGDFGSQYSIPGTHVSGTPSIGVQFAVGSGPTYGFAPSLAKNTTYYFNIRNLPSTYLDMPMFCDLINVPV